MRIKLFVLGALCLFGILACCAYFGLSKDESGVNQGVLLEEPTEGQLVHPSELAKFDYGFDRREYSLVEYFLLDGAGNKRLFRSVSFMPHCGLNRGYSGDRKKESYARYEDGSIVLPGKYSLLVEGTYNAGAHVALAHSKPFSIAADSDAPEIKSLALEVLVQKTKSLHDLTDKELNSLLRTLQLNLRNEELGLHCYLRPGQENTAGLLKGIYKVSVRFPEEMGMPGEHSVNLRLGGADSITLRLPDDNDSVDISKAAGLIVKISSVREPEVQMFNDKGKELRVRSLYYDVSVQTE